MTWFAFSGYNGGKAIDLAGIQEKEAAGFGFHGYGTEQLAEAAPNSVNFFQKAVVNGFIADYKVALAGQMQPGGKNASNPLAGGLQADARAVTNTVGNPLDWLSNIADFFGKLGQVHTWLRVAEVLTGIVLVGMGLNAMLKGRPMQVVTGTAGKIGKAAMF